MTERETRIELAAYERGKRAGRIQARAELNAEWRERLSNVLAILQKPIPTQKDDK